MRSIHNYVQAVKARRAIRVDDVSLSSAFFNGIDAVDVEAVVLGFEEILDVPGHMTGAASIPACLSAEHEITLPPTVDFSNLESATAGFPDTFAETAGGGRRHRVYTRRNLQKSLKTIGRLKQLFHCRASVSMKEPKTGTSISTELTAIMENEVPGLLYLETSLSLVLLF